jgi:hypothetical protein
MAPLLAPLLSAWSALHAEYWLLWTLHWRAKGTGYYGDHLLYQRLYEARQAEIDRMAEVIAAIGGASSLDPVAGLGSAREIVAQVEALPVPDVRKALLAAQGVLRGLSAADAAARSGPYALAVQNVLAGIADAHLEAVYLLQQREGGAVVLPPARSAPQPAPTYRPRSAQGRALAGAFQGLGGDGLAPQALGALGDALALGDADEADAAIGAVGKGLAAGGAAWALWRLVRGGR